MSSFIAWLNNQNAIVSVLFIVYSGNVLLSGVKKFLDVIKDKTATKLDDEADSFLGNLIDNVQKVLDMVGYNPAHPQAPVPAPVIMVGGVVAPASTDEKKA